MKRFIILSITIACLLVQVPSYAKKQSFRTWLNGFKVQAVAEGINPQFFDKTFRGITPMRRIINLDRSQPETRLTFLKYRNTRANKPRISMGRKYFHKHKILLNKIGHEYGVDPCVITAIWGMETAYGNYMGHFSVIRALATLAYEGRREEFFRKELVIALRILQEGHVTMKRFKGEWAGASGHSQFLPSSWLAYAVDYTGDGHKDIWTSHADAFASMANYLKQNGWVKGWPTRVQVILPYGFNKKLEGYKVKKTVLEWEKLGVHAAHNWHFPKQNIMASIRIPEGGPAYMVFKNWRVIMKYNYSTFYAGTITYLADKICRRPQGSVYQ